MALVLGLAFISSGSLIVGSVDGSTRTQSRQYMESLSMQYAERARNQIENLIGSLESLAVVLGRYSEISPDIRRELFVGILDGLVRENTGWYAVWSMWEPGAMDGNDGAWAGRTDAGSNSLGVFNPYLYRENGEVVQDVTDDMEEYREGYYTVPRDTGHMYITEPIRVQRQKNIHDQPCVSCQDRRGSRGGGGDRSGSRHLHPGTFLPDPVPDRFRPASVSIIPVRFGDSGTYSPFWHWW